MLKLYLMGLKGLRVLENIVSEFGSEVIAAVVCSRDTSIQKDYYDEMSELCNKHGILFYNRKEEQAVNCDYSVAIGWRWLIADYQRLIVFHDSILPAYRGFNPLVTALIKGDDKIGVTALWANAAYDAGDIIFQAAREISYPIKIADAIELVTTCYVELALRVCEHIKSGQVLPANPQDHSAASYSIWRDNEDYRINWDDSADNICRFIDAVGFPYNGAVSFVGDEEVKILDAMVVEDFPIVNRTAGKVFQLGEDNSVDVICGKGMLRLTTIKDKSGNDFKLKSLRTRFK